MTGNEEKIKKIEYLKKLINNYSVIAIADVSNVPSPQLQKIRASLKDSMEIYMAKKRLIKIAFESSKDSKKGIEKLSEHLKGMPSLIFTNYNPFKLSKILSKNKTKAPAKPGQEAPSNIKVPAGPTPFAPGPIIGELGQLGIKTEVKEGKINVKEDTIVVKEGEKINDKVAGVLSKLKIEPMEIGLNLMAAYENGLIYPKNILAIDEEKYLNDLKSAVSESFNLAVNIAYPAKGTIEILIKKAYIEGKALLDFSGQPLKEEKSSEEQEAQDKTQKSNSEEFIKHPKEESKQEETQGEQQKEEMPQKDNNKPTEEKQNTEEKGSEEPQETKEASAEERFKEEEKKAKEILNALQEEKLKNPSNYPKPQKEEKPINKGPKVEDLVPKDND